MSSHRRLQPLRERLSDEQLRARAAKTEVRQQLSIEHAKTRGLANMAMHNTQILRRLGKRIALVGGTVLLSLVSAVIYLWWRS